MTLYAALSSGQQTQIVTLDELRDHKYLLGGELGLKASKLLYLHPVNGVKTKQ